MGHTHREREREREEEEEENGEDRQTYGQAGRQEVHCGRVCMCVKSARVPPNKSKNLQQT